MFGELIEKAKALAAMMMKASEARSRLRTRYQVAGSLLSALTIDAPDLHIPANRVRAIQESLKFAQELEAKVYEDASDEDLDFDVS